MKKLALNLCMIIFLIPGFLEANCQKNILTSRKSKEVAVIKAVGGIILATVGSIHGFISGPVLMYEMRRSKYIMGGAMVSAVSLPIAYVGYKIAKSGIDDLHEIAQYS